MQLDHLIIHIKETHRQRVDLLKAQSGLTLRIKAICRRSVPETNKHSAGDKTQADKLYRALMVNDPAANDVAMSAIHLIETRVTLRPHILVLEKELVKSAKQLPVTPFVEAISGFGWIGLAQIIGETGNLANYSNPGKLWKRLGLAPYNGKSPAQWKFDKGLTSSDWIEVGYSPYRRSVMFVIGEALIKKQNEYRELYLTRKEYEATKAPDLKPMAHHLRAHRYMEKRLLRDLWRAWNEVKLSIAA